MFRLQVNCAPILDAHTYLHGYTLGCASIPNCERGGETTVLERVATVKPRASASIREAAARGAKSCRRKLWRAQSVPSTDHARTKPSPAAGVGQSERVGGATDPAPTTPTGRGRRRLRRLAPRLSAFSVRTEATEATRPRPHRPRRHPRARKRPFAPNPRTSTRSDLSVRASLFVHERRGFVVTAVWRLNTACERFFPRFFLLPFHADFQNNRK